VDVRRLVGTWSRVTIEFWRGGDGTGERARKRVLDVEDVVPVDGPVDGPEPRLTVRTASLIR
jgi:hypothetical protein